MAITVHTYYLSLSKNPSRKYHGKTATTTAAMTRCPNQIEGAQPGHKMQTNFKCTPTEVFLVLFSLCLLVVSISNEYNVQLLRDELRNLKTIVQGAANGGERPASEVELERQKRDSELDGDSMLSDRSEDYPYHSNGQTYNSNHGFSLLRNNGFDKRVKQGRLASYEDRIGGRIKALSSAHFSGDTSRYDIQKHDNFLGNGHLKHPRKTFVDWKANDWVVDGGMDELFLLREGILTVKQSGLYFVYAQIYYLDEHDRNGFKVFRNNHTVLQCTITAHSSERRMKGNTCYTAGVEYLNEGDGIELRDIAEGRYSVFEPGMSFFGLIRLGDVNMK